MTEASPVFKTPDLENQFMAVYESALKLWNVPHEAMDVPTRFGSTHINSAGVKEGPAMVLFPGFGANSTMWFQNAAALSSQFHIYAVDTPGQPRKSIPTGKLTAENSSTWITDVLDGLGLEKADLVGISLGGWLALHFAIHAPGRVKHVVMLDPAASFEKMSAAFLWHSFIPFMVFPTRKGLINYFHWMTHGYVVNPTWGELMLSGILNTRPQPPIRATPFSAAQLCSVQAAVLVLIGERSIIYDPQRARRRALQSLPDVRAEIIPGASHALIEEKSDAVNARILQFCMDKGNS